MCFARIPESDEAEDLRGEDDGHEGGTDAAHEFGRSGLLEERLGWDDDSGYGEADDEIAEQLWTRGVGAP